MRPLLSALCVLSLASCAPSITASQGWQPFRAAFSDLGVAWVAGGRACVARAPSFNVSCPNLPAASDVAWNGGDAWAAVPGLGVVVTLDRAARSVSVGRVAALSSTRAYREDGSAVNYAGEAMRGVLGTPSSAITGPSGEDYVLQAGKLLRVSDGMTVERAEANAVDERFLVSTPTGVALSTVPAAFTAFAGQYRLTGGQLQRLDSAGRVLGSVPHGPGRVGLVGQDVVTVSPEGHVRVYGLDLLPR